MSAAASGGRLALPQVTLCAVTSVNVAATVRALEACREQIAFADCLLLTDVPVQHHHPEIRVLPVSRLASAAAYSNFVLNNLADYVKTSHCLLVQWDGYVLDAARWRDEFLEYDYIGASWPQFDDGHDVGNGGFSLRSRKLMNLCRAPGFVQGHPEDTIICRTNRAWLETQGICFASRPLASRFAAERSGDPNQTFGYHGVFNMPRAIGVERFWHVYRELDERSSVWCDFYSIVKDMARTQKGWRRAAMMAVDRIQGAIWKGR